MDERIKVFDDKMRKTYQEVTINRQTVGKV